MDNIQLETFYHVEFINLDNEAHSLVAISGNLPDEIELYAPDLSQLTVAHRLTYRIQANWKTVIDNFLECYHCPIAHKDFVSLVEMETYQVKSYVIYSSQIAQAGRIENQNYDISNAKFTGHAVWYLWPNTALLRFPGRGNFMILRFIPAEAEQTYEEYDFS